MNTIGSIITGVLCAGAGFAAGYFIEKNHYEKIINTEIDESVKYFKDRYEALRDEIRTGNEVLNNTETIDIQENEESEKPLTAVKTSIDDLKPVNKKEMINYAKAVEPYKDDDEVIAHDGPYTITPEQYYGESGIGPDKEYAKEHMTYYEGDDIFAGTNEEIVAEGEKLIGKDNLDKFGEYEEDILFVRNDKTCTDYEVSLDPGEYGRFY